MQVEGFTLLVGEAVPLFQRRELMRPNPESELFFHRIFSGRGDSDAARVGRLECPDGSSAGCRVRRSGFEQKRNAKSGSVEFTKA